MELIATVWPCMIQIRGLFTPGFRRYYAFELPELPDYRDYEV